MEPSFPKVSNDEVEAHQFGDTDEFFFFMCGVRIGVASTFPAMSLTIKNLLVCLSPFDLCMGLLDMVGFHVGSL